jgi:hypothetical protein
MEIDTRSKYVLESLPKRVLEGEASLGLRKAERLKQSSVAEQ